jgi:hypothetical protein
MKANLYWCNTEDHDEDWFVFANSIKQALRWFEDNEGYKNGEVKAVQICSDPNFPDDPAERNRTDYPDWAQIDDLEKLGFTIIEPESPRVVAYNGVTYSEGDLPSNYKQTDLPNPDSN